MFKTALLAATLVAGALACSPAQRENIDRLDKYFGIQPFYPNGELGTNGYSNDYIKAAEDLNCNFNTPDKPTQSNDPPQSKVSAICKWQNMDSADAPNLDSEQFYVFHKTSNKAWSSLRPRRSRARQTPAIGDGFALTGGEGAIRLPTLCNRYKDQCDEFFSGLNIDTSSVNLQQICTETCAPPPQSVLYSAPLKCLENEATLSFDYWLFSNAGVRVMLLEQGTFATLFEVDMSDRKLTCSRTSPRDGRCKVKIPPQTKPFHLALHAHNLASKFVIVDNIEFTGDLGESCIETEDPYDFGTTVTTLPTRTGTTPITVDSDLNSNGGAAGTRWTNSGEGEVQWQVHTGPVDKDKWTTATGGNSVPTGDFLMARGNEGRAELMSDVIDCQQFDGELTLRAWASPDTDVQVCVVKADTLEPIYGCDMLNLPSDSPVTVPVFGPLDDFRLMIIGTGWDSGNGGFVAVDDIKYNADLCTGAPTVAPTDPDKIDEDACKDLSTDFDDQTLATTQWKVYPEKTYDGFNVKAHGIDKSFQPTPNTLVQCADDGKCAGVLLDRARSLEVGIMASPDFTLVKDRYLQLKLRRGTYGSYVHLCKNELPVMDPLKGGVFEGAVNSHCTKLSGPALTYKMYIEGEDVGATLPTDATKIFLVFTLPEDSGAERGGFLVDDILVLRGNTDASGALCDAQK